MADRTKSATPIAAKVIGEMKRHSRRKVVQLKDVIKARAVAEEFQRTVVSPQRLADLHAAHAAYAYAQNQVSVMSEMLTGLDAMAPLADIVSKAEYLYLPSGPPMSPLTVSYFSCWALFDACFGPADETIGTTILEVGAFLGMHAELLRLVRFMQRSRMGVYLHEGLEAGLPILRDLATDCVCRCVVPTGYHGEEGQIWYARVLPPPWRTGAEHVVFTTPYIVIATPLSEWMAYFCRVLPDAPQHARVAEAERHMKYGPSRSYWNEFVFEGYVNYTTQAVLLAGLPDVPESRPHSEAYRPSAG